MNNSLHPLFQQILQPWIDPTSPGTKVLVATTQQWQDYVRQRNTLAAIDWVAADLAANRNKIERSDAHAFALQFRNTHGLAL